MLSHRCRQKENLFLVKWNFKEEPQIKMCSNPPSPALIPTYINTNPLCDGNYANIFHSCVSTSIPFIGCDFYITGAMWQQKAMS